MDEKRKGSLTVEAAFVVPLCLMVIFCLISLAFLIHHKAWYTQAAWDSALCGTLQAEEAPESVIPDRLERLKLRQVFPVKYLSTDVTGSRTYTVTVSGTVITVWGIRPFSFTASARVCERDPVKTLFEQAVRRLEEKKK